MHLADLVRGDTGRAGAELVVPDRTQIGISLYVVDLEDALGAGFLRGKVPNLAVGNFRQFAEGAHIPYRGEFLDGRDQIG